MDCRQFRRWHAQFIDDTLSGVATWAMRDHIAECEACAGVDAQLRRALMLARNAPSLEVSPEFRHKLAARIAAEKLAGPPSTTRTHWRRRVSAAVIACLVIGAAAASTIGRRDSEPDRTLVMAPVFVTPPALPTEPVAAPAMFATVSSSLPVYPAMLLAQRAAAQFAATHARTMSFQAAH